MPSLLTYQPIIKRFVNIFRQTPDLVLEDDPKNLGHTVVKITFYLKSGFYGETKIRVREWFDINDIKIQYRYSWEKNNTKPGHISAWENEKHEVPHHMLPEGLKSDPHHHHHVPGDRSQLQDNWNTRDLERALSVVEEYILENKEYDGRL